MRNRVAVAALAALLGITADVRRPCAQPDRAERTAGEAPALMRLQLAHHEVEMHARGHGRDKVHRRPHVYRSLPNQRKIAERDGYQRVSELVNFPKFFPGLGIIFVKPETLPLGPFLCFDRKDRLVATVYMVPTKDINDHKPMETTGFAGRVDHVSFYFNPGHPGVDMPHYHVVIWHVTKKQEERVAKTRTTPPGKTPVHRLVLGH
ncbi:hypothetical protein IVA98_13645 [Bradyrhizobium sp. 160]|uniref:hypothetical protein n=1 Tax=unclassified Bradyrhizobium TaxID=2631580 RepID=UPI001FFB7161|nr:MULTISPECIES: hypothetical protein [unclassified Bradyrhizobium]MCK1543966.1 hypothetical protein [Bradyrhizobium sp. 179]MCK1624187.1 hypothetical protein [Bradyrhizobium sp. 160]